jgi:hypothetical protein
MKALHFFEEARIFEEARSWHPRRHSSASSLINQADAANMAFLLASESEHKVPSRMISSARKMAAASRELSNGRTLVRQPRQFAFFLATVQGTQRDPDKVRALLSEALQGVSHMRIALSRKSAFPALPVDVSTLRRFASVYRRMLRPVDDMIEDGLRAASSVPLPTGYYEILVGEAAQVAAFRRFWELISADVGMINTIVWKNHGYEEIADQIE